MQKALAASRAAAREPGRPGCDERFPRHQRLGYRVQRVYWPGRFINGLGGFRPTAPPNVMLLAGSKRNNYGCPYRANPPYHICAAGLEQLPINGGV